jgi:hypothetical protein
MRSDKETTNAMARKAGMDHDLLAMALVGYEEQKARIDAAIADIRARLEHNPDGQPASKKRTMSVAGRRRIAAAQRRRWAAVKKAKAKPEKPRRKLSAAGRKAIVAATKKRWAAVRKAKGKTKEAAAKRATAANA